MSYNIKLENVVDLQTYKQHYIKLMPLSSPVSEGKHLQFNTAINQVVYFFFLVANS